MRVLAVTVDPLRGHTHTCSPQGYVDYTALGLLNLVKGSQGLENTVMLLYIQFWTQTTFLITATLCQHELPGPVVCLSREQPAITKRLTIVLQPL